VTARSRFLYAIALICTMVNSARADRLIEVPIGRRLPLGELRFEWTQERGAFRTRRFYLGTGLTKNIDLELRSERIGATDFGTADISYNFQPPIVDLGPGISVGFLDVANRSALGRRAYLALTFRNGLETEALNTFADFTIGVSQGRDTLPFLAFRMPIIGEDFRVIGELDGKTLRAGLEFKQSRALTVRIVFEQNRVLLTGQTLFKF
jgi:hypothetical protein